MAIVAPTVYNYIAVCVCFIVVISYCIATVYCIPVFLYPLELSIKTASKKVKICDQPWGRK